MLGKDIVIYAGADPIAASKSCSVSMSLDTKEVTSPASGAWTVTRGARKTWSVSVNVLVVAVTESVLHVGDVVRLSWRMDNESADRLTGLAIATQCTISGAKGHMMTGTFKFQGCSPVVPLTNQIILNPVPFVPTDAEVLTGGRLVVFLDGTAVAASKSCEIQSSCKSIETASVLSGDYREYIPERKTWSVTTSHLVSAMGDDMLTVGTKVRLTFGVTKGGHLTADRLTGEAWVSEFKATGTVGNLATGSFHFTGSGELTQLVSQLYSNEPLKLQDVDENDLKVIYV